MYSFTAYTFQTEGRSLQGAYEMYSFIAYTLQTEGRSLQGAEEMCIFIAYTLQIEGTKFALRRRMRCASSLPIHSKQRGQNSRID